MVLLDYICFLNYTGYSQGAIDMIRSIDKTGKFDIKLSCLHNVPDKRSFSQNYYKSLLNMTKKPQNPEAIQIYQCIPSMHGRFRKSKKSIGFGIYETFEPPKEWIGVLNRMDAIICPSIFAFKQFAQAGVERPIFHIPHAIDTDLWNDKVTKNRNYDRFTFLFVGTWRKRKGWPQLIEAWFREFREYDNVQLVIKTDKSSIAKKEISKIKQNLGIAKDAGAPILFEDTIFDEESLPRFFKSTDCLVLPTLGEGFGLPPMQAMALKVPVIVTKFSGCEDYADENTCTIINPSGYMVHPMLDKIQQFRERKWPRITVEDIQKSMRFVLENPGIASYKADNAYRSVREKFNYDKIGQLFVEMMESVYGGSILEAQAV